MTTYAPELYRECEHRTPSQSAAKVAKANHPRNQTVKLPPLNVKVVPFHAYQGIRA